MTYVTVTPAYGRDYKSAKAALADWMANKDFRIATYGPDDGRYINREQVPSSWKVNIRYSNLTKVVTAR